MNCNRSRESATDIRDALDSEPSRAFRQVVAIEVFWTAEPGDSGFRDWEATVREALIATDPPPLPGASEVSEVEELFPRPLGGGE